MYKKMVKLTLYTIVLLKKLVNKIVREENMKNNLKESLFAVSRSKIALSLIVFWNILAIAIVVLSFFTYPLSITFFFIALAFAVNIILHALVQIRKRSRKFIQRNKLIDIVMSSYFVVSGILYCIFILPCLWVVINIEPYAPVRDYIQIGLCWFAIKNMLALYTAHEFKKHLRK